MPIIYMVLSRNACFPRGTVPQHEAAAFVATILALDRSSAFPLPTSFRSHSSKRLNQVYPKEFHLTSLKTVILY